MTLLNTVANLASKWPTTLALSVVDAASLSLGGTQIDGFYILTGVCTFVGTAWYIVMMPRAVALSSLPMTAWRVAVAVEEDVEMV